MATQPSTPGEQKREGEQRQREHETQRTSPQQQLVVVELERPATPDQVRRLRRGRGRLVRDIDEVIDELNESGTIKAGTQQPVVIVVREISPFLWPLNIADYEEDDDEEEEEEDEDE